MKELLFILAIASGIFSGSYTYKGQSTTTRPKGVDKKYFFDCRSIQSTDASYFNKHKLVASFLDTTNLPSQNNAGINIQLGGRNLVFMNDSDVDDKMELTHYYYAGIDKEKSWTLIKKQTWQNDYYYLINSRAGIMDTLVGYPQIYGNTMICLEGAETDGSSYIEIWQIETGSIKLKSKFSLNNCNIFPFSITLSDLHELLIKAGGGIYYKVKM